MEDLVLSCLESRVEANRNLYTRFLVGPFLKGDALTVATALRRVLLSSVESIGITALYIQGITHEFSIITGVRESVLELSLNFQAIVLCYDKSFLKKKNFFDDIQIGYLQVQGPKVVYANDLKLPLGIKLVDPTQYIATVSKEGSIVLKFIIGKKSNFLRSEAHTVRTNLRFATRAIPMRKAQPFPVGDGGGDALANRRFAYAGALANRRFACATPVPCALASTKLSFVRRFASASPYGVALRVREGGGVNAALCKRTANLLTKRSFVRRFAVREGQPALYGWPCPVGARARGVNPCSFASTKLSFVRKFARTSRRVAPPYLPRPRPRPLRVARSAWGRGCACKSSYKAKLCTCKRVPLLSRAPSCPYGARQGHGKGTGANRLTKLSFVLASAQQISNLQRGTKHKKQSIYFPFLGELSKKNITTAKKGSFYKDSSTINCFRTETWFANKAKPTFYKKQSSGALLPDTLFSPLLGFAKQSSKAPRRRRSEASASFKKRKEEKKVCTYKAQLCTCPCLYKATYKAQLCTCIASTKLSFVRRFARTGNLTCPPLLYFTEGMQSKASKVGEGKTKQRTYMHNICQKKQGFSGRVNLRGIKDDIKLRFNSLTSNKEKIKTRDCIHTFNETIGTPVKQLKFNSFKSSKESTFLSKNKVFKSDICLRNIIPLDLTLTPVLKVNFVIEIDDDVLYLRQKVRERIILEVWTNGSIHPRQAVHDAALSLTDMFASFRSIYQVQSTFLPLFKINQFNKTCRTRALFCKKQSFPSYPFGGAHVPYRHVKRTTHITDVLGSAKQSSKEGTQVLASVGARNALSEDLREQCSTNLGLQIEDLHDVPCPVRLQIEDLHAQPPSVAVREAQTPFRGLGNEEGSRGKARYGTHDGAKVLSKKKINNNFVYKTKLERNSLFFSDMGSLALPVNIYSFLKKKGIKKFSTLNNLSSFDLLLLLKGNTEMFYTVKRCLLKNNFSKS